MNIVVTGFEAFHKNNENPTEEVIKLLPRNIKGHKIIPTLLPVLYNESFQELKKVIEQYKPEVVISLGLAGGRIGITPERVAVNIADASIGDNNKVVKTDETIETEGKNAYFTTLPIKAMIAKLKEKHIDCYISNSAGAYVCNDLMYRTLHYIELNKLEIKAGFIHVPYMTEQEAFGKYQMPLPDILEAVIDCIKVSL